MGGRLLIWTPHHPSSIPLIPFPSSSLLPSVGSLPVFVMFLCDGDIPMWKFVTGEDGKRLDLILFSFLAKEAT